MHGEGQRYLLTDKGNRKMVRGQGTYGCRGFKVKSCVECCEDFIHLPGRGRPTVLCPPCRKAKASGGRACPLVTAPKAICAVISSPPSPVGASA
jgi:hypothetical protein